VAGGGHATPLFKAGLPDRSPTVCVGPPFAARGPSLGSEKRIPTEQGLSLLSLRLRFGHSRFPPPFPSVLEQFLPMFHGLPPLAAVLFATIEFLSVTFAADPPTMPPPTQSAWLPAIVTFVRSGRTPGGSRPQRPCRCSGARRLI
jgi:hypothetical protein